MTTRRKTCAHEDGVNANCQRLFGPLPTTKFTFASLLSVLRGFGRCERTRPFFLRVETFLVIFPTRQWAFLIRALAFASFRPTTFGTTHFGTFANAALAEWFALIVSAHAPVPEQSPDQPVNFEPVAAVAVSVTAAPSVNCTKQLTPQLMPPGELLTVPEPEPVFVTMSVRRRTNVAVTVLSPSTVTAQAPVPEQLAPDQPVNTEPELATAWSTTEVPCPNINEQVVPQLIPVGVEVTKPEPFPAFVAVSLWTVQEGNLNEPILVRQSNEAVVA